jgi:phage host-nuclease inhibitor protein Gam
VQYEPQAKVVDRDKFLEWCKREGLERQLMLPWQTTNKLTKDALLAGQPEPDGVTAESRVKFVFAKG